MDVKGFLTRAVAFAAGAALFVGAFLVSVVFFAVALAVAVVVVGYFLWRTRHVRRQMREQFRKGDVIEGTVISSETVRPPDRD